MKLDSSIAIAHKDYDVRGGGERVAEYLSEIFDAPMYVGRYLEENTPKNFSQDITEIPHSWLTKKAVDLGSAPRSLAYMWTWQYVPELAEYDTVITSGNEPLWYVREPRQTVVSYCHSPPRYQYDRFQDGYGSSAFKRAYSMVVRTLLETNRLKPDLWVANSDLVKRRIQTTWGVEEDNIVVIYPPVEVEAYDPSLGYDSEDEYFFHIGRLDDMKRVNEIVEAFDDLDASLKVAGKGPRKEALESKADENVEFLGYVDEDEKRRLLAGAQATIFNAENEDFGLVPIESMAAGTPVLGVSEGFTQEQIIHGKNGLLYDRGVENIRQAVSSFQDDEVEWSDVDIAEFASQFGVERFEKEMRESVAIAEKKAEVQGPKHG